MAPEVVNRKGHGIAADWWSYGVLMVGVVFIFMVDMWWLYDVFMYVRWYYIVFEGIVVVWCIHGTGVMFV